MAKTIYVSPDGRDRWHDGKLHTATSFQQAIEEARPGDTIELLPGVYDEPVTLRDKKASEHRPITIVGHSGTTLDGRRNPVRPPGIAKEERYAFVKIVNSCGIVIENMTIQNVWPTAVFIQDSQHITVRRMNLNGATFGIFARGEATEHLIIENCSWIQDERIWSDIRWFDIHEEPFPRKEMDGDFFRSFQIKGHVIIRQNFIAQAFNGVHFFACPGDKPGRYNSNVWIYRNTFTFIRDNAVEAENSATNWWVFENKIYNCHKWFAFERCNGGHIYVFANRGWFDRLPGPEGDEYNGGGVIKANKIKRKEEDSLLMQHPTYMFNNSWYLRSSYVKKGKLRHFNHFNNAIDYAKPDDHPSGVVKTDRKMIGSAFTKEWRFFDIRFENDVCNHPDFPAGLNADGYPVSGIAADPEFDTPKEGYFDLSENSPCRENGMAKTIALKDGSTWELKAGFNIGAMRECDQEFAPYTPLELDCPQGALPKCYDEDRRSLDRSECDPPEPKPKTRKPAQRKPKAGKRKPRV